MNTKVRTAAILAVLAVAAGALTVWASLAGAASSRQTATLKGAGSTFVQPLVTQWIENYHASSVQYSGIGSGGGIAAISSRSVDFGASDAPLSRDQFANCHGCVQIPWALSATSIPYHITGVGQGLKLTGKVLAGIYLGRVHYWDNPLIKSLNKGVKLPHEKIVPIYRSDASGTSYNFTDYLAHVSKPWKSKVGRGTQPAFPVGVGAAKSSGVAAKLNTTPGGITYVDVAYSIKNHFTYAKIQNRAHRFVGPTLASIRAAGKSLLKLRAKDNSITIVDPNPRQPKAYPISTFTYVVVPLKTGKAAALKKFIDWAVTKGQTFGPRLLFVPLPKLVKKAARKTTARLHT